MVGKQVIGDGESECPQIVDGKYRRGAGIALAKCVYLPNTRYEFGDMLDDLLFGKPSVLE